VGQLDLVAQMLLAGDVLDGSTVVVSAGLDGLVIGDRIVPSSRERPASVVVH
jgi:ATP-dependent Clp protease ATP-binding subunit ClpB